MLGKNHVIRSQDTPEKVQLSTIFNPELWAEEIIVAYKSNLILGQLNATPSKFFSPPIIDAIKLTT